MREVHYYYLDYREFANVTKYRIAMMRRAIDEKIKQVSTARTAGPASLDIQVRPLLKCLCRR